MAHGHGLGFGYNGPTAGAGGLGPELITNGAMDDGTGWSADSNWTFEDGWVIEDGLGSLRILSQTITPLEPGHTYRVSFEIRANPEDADVYLIGVNGKISQALMTRSAVQVHTADVLITAGLELEILQITNELSAVILDNFSIREVL